MSKLVNCILWANTDSSGTGEAAQIYGGTPDVNHCLVQGWTDQSIGAGNINSDPLFTSGPQGDYYLSQIAAGQAQDSPCTDAGDKSATHLEMNRLTTRTDEFGDTDIVDIGYHYSRFDSVDLDGDGRADFADFAGFAAR